MKNELPPASVGAPEGKPIRPILVTGDLIIDHHIYEGERHHYGDSSPGVQARLQAGGASLVADLIKSLPGFDTGVFCERKMPDGGCDRDIAHHAYAFWRALPAGSPPEKRFWRCDEAMGFGERGETPSAPPCCTWAKTSGIPEQAEIVVISEGGMGFRDSPACLKDLPLETAQIIILKTAWPVAKGALWEELSGKHRERMMVVVSADELRKSSARLGSGLSWEATFHDLLREIQPGGRLSALGMCRHLVVTFGSEGAAWFDFGRQACPEGKPTTRPGRVCLIYRAGCLEHDHARGTEGTAFGFLTCVTAALARASALSEDPLEADFAPALEAGLSAMHDLREKGHGSIAEKPDGFPFERLAGVICNPEICFTRAFVPWPEVAGRLEGPSASFLSLAGRVDAKHPENTGQTALEFARLTAIHGPCALQNLPHLRVGKLIAADRGEVESLRVLEQIVRNYDKNDKGKKPLSIGVFGPPGAGKSFAVSEIAKTFLGERVEWLEFNLSQFASPDELNGAFHRVRDAVLQGKLPVAFFDEFDSRAYFWLQYLLAPMQDGRFQQGQNTHTLGKSIFIFAGGTGWTHDSFGPPEPQPGTKSDDPAVKRFEEFRLAKGPDFRSRLDAFLDVVGPNQRVRIAREKPNGTEHKADYEVSGHLLVVDQDDWWFHVRRALFLRNELGLAPDQRLEIDPGLLHALLSAPKYNHGSRSLVKVLASLKQALPRALQPSHLPAPAQLMMHVDLEIFRDLCNKDFSCPPELAPLSEDVIAVIAPEIHQSYNRLGIRSGWMQAGDALPLEEYAKKEPFKAKSNDAAARRMPAVLACVGLRLESGAGDAGTDPAVLQYIEYHLELLASAEHLGWMKWHFDNGWTYHPKRDDKKKRHDCLKAFTELKEADRVKDREQVRHYPDFARKADLRVVFSSNAP